MGHNPKTEGSTKLVAAQRRRDEERSFLKTLSVQHDDPDAVLDDEGKRLSIRQLLNVPGVQFVQVKGLDVTPVLVGRVVQAFNIIKACTLKIQALGGK